MFKVCIPYVGTALSPQLSSRASLQGKNCQICGNRFFPSHGSARTCEFCKTPFTSVLSGAMVTAMTTAMAG